MMSDTVYDYDVVIQFADVHTLTVTIPGRRAWSPPEYDPAAIADAVAAGLRAAGIAVTLNVQTTQTTTRQP